MILAEHNTVILKFCLTRKCESQDDAFDLALKLEQVLKSPYPYFSATMCLS